MNDTRQLTANAYPSGHKIDAAYIDKAAPVIERQLALADIELWKALHEVAQHTTAVQTIDVSVSQETITEISLDDIANHIAEMVRVCGRVYA